MKIVQSIQNLYNSKWSLYQLLKVRVDDIIKNSKKEEWHYVGRIKQVESFALKIETGRFCLNNVLEDFFACTLVVKNLSEIDVAEKLIRDRFNVRSRRPHSQNSTHKDSFSFPFDDLRIYVSLKDLDLGDLAPEMYDLVFEIQIKTFLQHAWSIATHDLIYKSDKINWGKERVAYQVKAALEHAEVTISGVEELSKVGEIAKENKEVKKVNLVIAFLGRFWKNEDLPKDRRRLAQNIISLIEAINIRLPELTKIMEDETKSGRGAMTMNLSPYLIIVQTILNSKQAAIINFLSIDDGNKQKILFTKELTLPPLVEIIENKIIDLRN